MYLILCRVNNNLQGRGKLKCVRQILIHFRCLRRRNTKYSRRDSPEGGEDWSLLAYLLFSSLSFFASLPLLTLRQFIADHPLREKTHQVFPVHPTPEKNWNATIIGRFGFVFERNLGQENHMFIVTSSFLKSSVSNCFSVYTKTQSRRFQIPPFWRVFSESSVFVTD